MEKKQDVLTEKRGRGRPVVYDPNQKRSICIYLKPDTYNTIQKRHEETYVPISKIVELALEKYFG